MGQIIYPKRDYATMGKIAYPSRKQTIFTPSFSFNQLGNYDGILNYLGENEGNEAWQNPHTRGFIEFECFASNGFDFNVPSPSLISDKLTSSDATNNQLIAPNYYARLRFLNHIIKPTYFGIYLTNSSGNFNIYGDNIVRSNSTDIISNSILFGTISKSAGNEWYLSSLITNETFFSVFYFVLTDDPSSSTKIHEMEIWGEINSST